MSGIGAVAARFSAEVDALDALAVRTFVAISVAIFAAVVLLFIRRRVQK